MSEDEYIGRAFVRYPPDDPRAIDDLRIAIVVEEDDITSGDLMALDLAMIRAENDNPAGKAQAVCDLHAERVYPPTEVMAWLAEGFGRWIEADGETPLEVCLGLRRPEKKSAANRLDALNRENRRSNLAYEVRRLRLAFRLSRSRAAGIVAASIAAAPDPLTETTLEQFEKALPRDPIFDDVMSEITDETRLKILSHYPPHAYRDLICKSRILQRIAKKSGIK